MIGKAIAGWIGNRIDRRDGEGGAAGAVTAVVAYEVAKRVVPAALVIGGAVLAYRHFARSAAA